MHASKERRNMLVIANAIELAVQATSEVLGYECSKELDGVKATQQILASAIAARINSHLSVKISGQ